MTKLRTRNNRGFAYIVAVGILGLLAFMGLFLMQSSSIEYSQTSVSVYRTMGRQLAEAAAEEACVMLEERFKDKSSTGFFQQLIWQASTSGPMRTGGQTGKNPSPLNDFTDLNKKVTQTLALRDYHVSRAGFSIDKILPTIKDLRPIPNGPMDFGSCYYRPKDRENPFDTELSNNWYCTLQIDVTLSLEKSHKISINYQISKDIKILNLAPIARNYTFFSILGQQVGSNDSTSAEAILRNGMNLPDTPAGRLILWNQPFQSRVYLHGPTIINLENPILATDRQHWGAYNTFGEKQSKPGPNHAFQYSDTFYGFSYYPTVSRCLFPSKNWSGIFSSWFSTTDTKEDLNTINNNYGGIIQKDTVYGGLLPEPDPSFWSRIGDGFTEGLTDNYLTGTNVHQKFLPAGPYCCTPWRYTPSTPKTELSPFRPNQKDPPPMSFPETEDTIHLEHRWVPDNDEVDEKTKIYARCYGIKYNHVTGNLNGGNAPEEVTTEFGLNYYNNPDPEGFLAKLGASAASLGKGLWNVVTLPAQAFSNLISPLVGKLLGGGDSSLSADEEVQSANLYPTNFRFNYQGIATRRLNDETEIPKDSEGRWILNGVYWLSSLNIEAPITYIGTGTLMVSKYTAGKPVTIKGSVVAARSSDGVPQGHMNIFYHPYTSTITDVTDRMLTIEGTGITIEAGVYSCYGIRSISSSGNITDFPSLGADPTRPFDQWGSFLQTIIDEDRANVIFGNYVNFYMNLNKQTDDLWVVHNYQNPLYFTKYNNGYIATQELLDIDENNRKSFEYGVHEFFMSPKIQHIGIRGAL